ncbi:MAG TPA: hypothetical protein PK872_06315 [Ferruginibacter sp.]|nr:hypothetical protein [Ferruginibacter sp.]
MLRSVKFGVVIVYCLFTISSIRFVVILKAKAWEFGKFFNFKYLNKSMNILT